MAIMGLGKWQGGPKFIKLKRGSKTSRLGGSHSGNVPKRRWTGLGYMQRMLILARKKK